MFISNTCHVSKSISKTHDASCIGAMSLGRTVTWPKIIKYVTWQKITVTWPKIFKYVTWQKINSVARGVMVEM